MISALAIGCYRHDRREGQSLVAMHANLASSIDTYYGDATFATGILGRIDTVNGVLTWTNAGHPLPLLLRGGRVIRQLACPPTPPWGTFRVEPTVATEQLEPGDSVVLFTDGVIEARSEDGESFGIDRLIELTERYAADDRRPDHLVRDLVRNVHEHRGRDLADDATVVLARWQ
jgi:serine phosphatase RsbU (regulator of sigma subunit)